VKWQVEFPKYINTCGVVQKQNGPCTVLYWNTEVTSAFQWIQEVNELKWISYRWINVFTQLPFIIFPSIWVLEINSKMLYWTYTYANWHI